MPAGEFTLILQQVDRGEPTAADKLLPLVYDQLRQLAAAKLARESADQTLQPTALVHEAWLRLGGDPGAKWSGRAHFFGAAAEAMRRILIDNARRKRAARNGGDLLKVSTDAGDFDLAGMDEDERLLLINEALDELARHDPRKAEVVKQRYFTGLTLEEVAEVLGISLRTVKRDRLYARAWLYDEIKRLRV